MESVPLSQHGTVSRLSVITEARGRPSLRERLVIEPDGVVDDRKKGATRHVIVVTEEGWAAACEALGVDIDPTERRGQVVVRGVDLGAAVGGQLVVGSAVLNVIDECTPCGRMNGVQPGLREALRPDVRAGVWCVVQTPGEVCVGDPVRVVTGGPAALQGSTSAIRAALIMPPVFGDFGSPLPLGLAYLRGALRRAHIRADFVDSCSQVRNDEPDLYDDLLRQAFPGAYGGTVRLDALLLLDVLYPGWRDRGEPLAARVRTSARAEVAHIRSVAPDLDVACIHVANATVLYAAAMAQAFREHGTPVLLGGPSITDIATRETLLSLGLCDAAMIGEGDERIVAVVRALAGRGDREVEGMTYVEPDGSTTTYPGGGLPRLKGLGVPDFDGMGIEEYGYIPIISSRGCINNCTYCSERSYVPQFRLRPVDEVLAEMDVHAERYGVTRFQFHDALINSRMRWLETFCDELEARGSPYTWDSFFVPDGLGPGWGERLLRAGCPTVRVGVEHLAPRMLRLMQRESDVQELEATLIALAEEGISVQMDLVVGFPGETEDDHRECVDRLRRLLARSPRLSVLVNAYCFNPGSPVAADPARYGVERLYFEPGVLPPGAERAREALSRLVIDHRCEPRREVVARWADELRAIAGEQRLSVQDRQANVPGTANYVHQRIAAHERGLEGSTGRETASADEVRGGPLTLSVVDGCNQACVFCSSSATGPDLGTQMTPDEVAERVRAAGPAATMLVLTGGEPTLSARCTELIAAARQAGTGDINVVLETNACLIGADPRVAGALRDAGLGRAVVSLHAASAQQSDALTRAPGTFAQTMAGIHALLKHGIPVTIRTVVFRDNLAELEPLAALLAAEFGSRVRWELVSARYAGRAAECSDLLVDRETALAASQAACAAAASLGLQSEAR